MAIYHLHCKILGRSTAKNKRNALAAAAYRAGDTLVDYKSGQTFDYSKKTGIVYSEILLCENAPEAYRDRETLWNAVQEVEKRVNSYLCREIEVAIPRELKDDYISIVRTFSKSLTAEGMIADVSIHDKGDGNPHAHILLTMRRIDCNGNWEMVKEKKVYALDENGERIPIIDPKTGQQKIGKSGRRMWKRIRTQESKWDRKEALLKWRKDWADICNEYIGEHNRVLFDQNIDVVEELRPEPVNRIDHRSNSERGINKIPTTHEGYMARKMERNGNVSDRCSENRFRKRLNELLERVNRTIKEALKFLEKYTKSYVKEVKRHEEAVGRYRCYENRRTSEDHRKTGGFDKGDVSTYSETESRERETSLETDQIEATFNNYIQRLEERKKLYQYAFEQTAQQQISKKRNEFELEL